jgi:FAD/FMN-containing dehydrogenase
LISGSLNAILEYVAAGTKLHLLGQLLFERGLAQENLGDIDVQSIAGAISTGSHGTGLKFGTIATTV